jgi:PAS domain S-box-containing protein
MAEDSEAMLASVFAASLDCIVVIDEQGIVLEFNPAAEAAFGYSREEALGSPITELIVPPHHRHAHNSGLARYVAGGEPRVVGKRVNVEAMRSDGSVFPAELALTEARMPSGRRIFTASVRDLTEQRETEDSLRESEARLEAFFKHAPAAMYLKSTDGRYERVNEYTGTMMRQPVSVLIGGDARHVVRGDEADEVAELDRQVLQTGQPLVTEQTFHIGEKITHVVSTRFPIRDLHGEITHIGVVLIDVTDRVEAERKLRDSEAKLTGFLDHAPAAMYLKDEEGRFVVVNRFLANRFETTPEALIGLRPMDLIDPAAAEELARTDQLIRETGEPQIQESEFHTSIGVRSGLSIRFPVKDDAGAHRYIGGVILDTTDRIAAERRLRASEARLAAFMQHAPLTMFLKDAEGRYLLVNQQAATNLGLPIEQIIGKTAEEVAPPEVAIAGAALESEVLAAGIPRTDEQVFDLAVGRVYGLNTRFPVPDETGALTQIGGVYVDITAQKVAEEALIRSREALVQSEKLTALGSLLAGVSHELNNPLAVVVGEAILLEEDAENTPFAASARRIRKSADRCSRIVQTFLAMARQRPPERVRLDVEAVALAAIELTHYGMRSNGIRVSTDFEAGLPPVAADNDQLHQVLVNLLINAQQALQDIEKEREIRVSTHYNPDKERVCIKVADNGPGIPPDIARRIFEPFFTTKPQGSGTGIGLSFSHGVVEAHGGNLLLENGDKGAAFLIELPVNPAPEPAAVTPVGRTAAQVGRAMVVDDEPELADSLARFLEREGYGCTVVNSGREAIELARTEEFDIILSDLRMADVDGPMLLKWLSSNRPRMASRLGYVTGDTLGPAAVRFLGDAGRPFIEKPFSRQSIRNLLAELAGDSSG